MTVEPTEPLTCDHCGKAIEAKPGETYMGSTNGRVWHYGCRPSARSSTPQEPDCKHEGRYDDPNCCGKCGQMIAQEPVADDDALIDKLCNLCERVQRCWQSPTGEPPLRRPKSFTPEWRDANTLLDAMIFIERVKATRLQAKAPETIGSHWRCVNCKLVTPERHRIAPDRCPECHCSQFAEVWQAPETGEE